MIFFVNLDKSDHGIDQIFHYGHNGHIDGCCDKRGRPPMSNRERTNAFEFKSYKDHGDFRKPPETIVQYEPDSRPLSAGAGNDGDFDI